MRKGVEENAKKTLELAKQAHNEASKIYKELQEELIINKNFEKTAKDLKELKAKVEYAEAAVQVSKTAVDEAKMTSSEQKLKTAINALKEAEKKVLELQKQTAVAQTAADVAAYAKTQWEQRRDLDKRSRSTQSRVNTRMTSNSALESLDTNSRELKQNTEKAKRANTRRTANSAKETLKKKTVEAEELVRLEKEAKLLKKQNVRDVSNSALTAINAKIAAAKAASAAAAAKAAAASVAEDIAKRAAREAEELKVKQANRQKEVDDKKKFEKDLEEAKDQIEKVRKIETSTIFLPTLEDLNDVQTYLSQPKILQIKSNYTLRLRLCKIIANILNYARIHKPYIISLEDIFMGKEPIILADGQIFRFNITAEIWQRFVRFGRHLLCASDKYGLSKETPPDKDKSTDTEKKRYIDNLLNIAKAQRYAEEINESFS